MNKQTATVLFLTFLFSSAIIAQDSVVHQPMPVAIRERVAKVDIKHIAIDLKFDWIKKSAYGTATITLSSLTASDTVSLDAAMLTINSITLLNGASLKFHYSEADNDDNLKIKLDRTYTKGEDLTIIISYRTNWINATDPNSTWGSVGKGIRFLEPSSTDPKRRRQVWSMGEPESNRYWFPCYDAPNDLRTTEFSATVDNKLKVISNGELVETKMNPNRTRTFRYLMDKPYQNFRTSFVIGEYVYVKQKYNGVTLNTICYPDEKEAAEATVVRLPDMVKFFSDITGAEYPYKTYSQVFVQELPWGHGNATLSTHTENMIDDFRTHEDFFYLWDGLEAEGLASQWFGNYLSCRHWSDIWLNRGFARYFDGLYCEYKNGKDEFLLYNHYFFNQNSYLSDWNSGKRHPIVTNNYENTISFTSDNYSYFRGALVLHMLRKHLGEDNWKKAIRHYVKENADRQVTTDDFRKAIEEITGEDMRWFFDQWVYKMGHPVFTVTKTYDKTKKKLTLVVTQTQKIDSTHEYPQTEFFKGKMDIEIDGRIEQVCIESKQENIFIFNLDTEPKLVNFDYESAWIKEIKFEKSIDELLYQFLNDNDILGRRWALTELGNYMNNEKTSTEEKTKILKAFRKTILGNSYWRLKYMTLLRLQNLLVPSGQKTTAKLDEETLKMLLIFIKKETSWNRAIGISFLGTTKDPKYADLYLSYFSDKSERVINAAANALGKTKSPKAFDELVKLKDKPSWKNQSLISTLNGLKELGDQRGVPVALKAFSDISSPRWTLATPVWDYRIAAAETLVALGKADSAYPIVLNRFNKSIQENNINDIFCNVQLAITLRDARGQQIFDELRIKFKDDPAMISATDQYEAQFKEVIKPKK